MRRPRHSPTVLIGSPFAGRSSVWLAISVLLVASLPLHGGPAEHGALDGPTLVWMTHCRPGPVSHLEPVTALVEVPRCTACVQQLQGVGVTEPARAENAALVVAGQSWPGPSQAPSQAQQRLALSRGPPAA